MDYHSLSMKTVAELRRLGKDAGLRIPSSANKALIIDILLKAGQEAQKAEKPEEPKADKPEAPKAEKQEAPKPEKPEPPKADKPEAPKPETPKPEAKKAEKPEAQKANARRSAPQGEKKPDRDGRTAQAEAGGRKSGRNDKPAADKGGKNAPSRSDRGSRRPQDRPRKARGEEAPAREEAEGTAFPAAPEEAPPSVPAAEAVPARPEETSVPEGMPVGDFADGSGILEVQQDGYGFLRAENCLPGKNDTYLSIAQIRRFNLRTGDFVEGKTRPQRDGDRYSAMVYITRINGRPPEEARHRRSFETLTPIYPNERLQMECSSANDLSLRLIDLLAPIGKGQRGMIVSQPKAGKTTMLKKIANAISENNPEVRLLVLLIDERPEEVTDMKRSIKGDVIFSTFDEAPENHARVSEMVLEHAQRMVEMGQDVVILLDSITRLARAYNLIIPPTGRSLSGGLDPGALYRPKRFFGAARNIENGGSLTIIATALVETGSRMDDIIFEEFKGTGNMELHLDRKLSDRRIFPAIDLVRSSTRRDELLLSEKEMEGVLAIRRVLSNGNPQESTELLLSLIERTPTYADFVSRVKGLLNAYAGEGYRMR